MQRFFRTLILLSVCLSFATAQADTVAIPYTVKHEGQVSLAIYDQQSRLVRTLLTGAPRRPGEYAEAWDGCDRYGIPQPPGKYIWKLLETKGLAAEFLLQVSQNPTPQGEAGPGNHGGPGSVVADESGVYFIGFSEGAHTFVKTDRDGKYIYARDPWATNPNAHRGINMALLNGKLYGLAEDGWAYGYEGATGACFTDADTLPKPWNLNWPGVTNKVIGAMNLATDPANKLLVVSYREQNGLRWFDTAQKGKQVDELTGLDQPLGVAVRADGTILVIMKGAVWSLTRTDKTPKPVIAATKLQSPWRLDVNRKTGEILVAENSDEAGGPRHHQIKKFSAAGELLATYGKAEGRRDGPYIATDFRGINSVCFDPLGGFLVCEGPWTPPRRTARFDDTGKVLHEWFGGQAYGTLCTPEPGDPTHAWFYGNAPKASGLVRCEIDFATRSWRVVETYHDVFLENELPNIAPGYLQIMPRDGKLYLSAGTEGRLSIAVYDPNAKTVRPSNYSGIQRELPRAMVPEKFHDLWDSFIWNDLNDDGHVTADEMIWMHRPCIGGYVDPQDFTVYLIGQACAFYDGQKVTPRRFTAGGTPVYDWADAQPFPVKWKEGDDQVSIMDLQHNPDGTWYGCFAAMAPAGPVVGLETHGKWFFNSCSGVDRLVKWDKDWKPLWSVGRHSPDADHEVGSTAQARYLGGDTHGCVMWVDCSDEETAGPTVWTDDGLYVDELWRIHGDTSNEKVYGIQTANELPTGRLYTDPKTGRVLFYMITCGLGSTVYEIHGWDGWRRDQGKIELKRPQPPAVSFTGTGLRGEYFSNLDLTGTPALTRTDSPLYFLWNTAAPAPPLHSGSFSIRWSGQVQPPTTEPYKFSVETYHYWLADGPPKFLRLWVNGRKLVDTSENLDEQWVLLKAGEKYDIRIEAAWAGDKAIAKLCWETKTNDRRVIQPKFLYPSVSSQGGAAVAGSLGSSVSLWFRTEHGGDIATVRDNAGHVIQKFALHWGNITAATGAHRLTAEGEYADGQWHQIVHVIGDPCGDQRLYVDGTLRAVGESTAATNGANIEPARHAELRDTRCFDHALSVLDIQDALYRREAGLLAHISFDDGQGIHPACESAVPGLTVNIIGDTEWTKDGRVGGALTTKPNGPLQPAYVMIGNQLELPATDYTIAFWFKTTDATGNLFCAVRRSPYNSVWTDNVLLLSDGKLGFGLFGQDGVYTPNKLNDGQWHLVATTVGGATKDSRFYVDGKLIGAGKLAVRQYVSNRLGVNLGGPVYGYNGVSASFDDFRCYGRVLTESEVRNLFTK